MSLITITHDAADGTLVDGDPRPHHGILKAAGFRWSRSIGGWYIPNSRDRAPRTDRIERVATELRVVGFDVEVTIDTERRSAEERHDAAVDRLADRQDALDAKAGRKGAEADALYAKARQMADAIPLGQPILVDHYSARTDRNYRDRMNRTYARSFETADEARETTRRAEASRALQAHKASGPATIRRIERLNTERRDIERKLAGELCPRASVAVKPGNEGHEYRCPGCYQMMTVTPELRTPVHYVGHHEPASGEWADRLNVRLVAIDDDLAFEQAHLAALAESGEYVAWTPDQFAKGDRVNNDCTIVRVNKKSLSVKLDSFADCSWTNTMPYDKVRSHQPGGTP